MSTTVNGTTGITFPDGTVQNTVSLPGMRNRIINGSMQIDQRNAGASVTPDSGNSYNLDRWKTTNTQASKYTVQQNAGSVTPPAGFKNYAGITSASAYTVLSTDNFNYAQNIEGLNVSDLGWGAAGASSVALSFWVRSSLTGTFGGALQNSAQTRSYPFSFTISAANTWEQKSITVAGDTTGTWLTTNGIGLRLVFSLGSGSTYITTANAWAAGEYYGVTGQTNIVSTNGATFYITGVQLEKGSTATSFDYRPYGTELALCQRYYYKIIGSTSTVFAVGSMGSSSIGYYFRSHPVFMRASPTISSTASGFTLVNTGPGADCTNASISGYSQMSLSGHYFQATGTAGGASLGIGSAVLANSASSYVDYSSEL